MSKIGLIMMISIVLLMNIINAQQQVSRNEARNAAISTFHNKAEVLKHSPNLEIDTVYSFFNNRSNVLMYEVVFKNRAAILLSGSKACMPVLGYYIKPKNDNGAIFDTTNTNVSCCLQAFLHDYAQEIEWCFAQDSIELYYAAQWDSLQHPNVIRDNPPTTIIVQPLLTTKWDQSWSNDGECDAYNYYITSTHNACDCTSKRCLAGCVAVAMAQIMKYWNYPVYLPNQDYQFDWCNMKDELLVWFKPYHPLNPTPFWVENQNYEKERNAIAYLLKDCGTKANMTYCGKGKCSAGAYSSDARNALVNSFDYNRTAAFLPRALYTNINWKTKIRDNLESNIPVYYAGSGSKSNQVAGGGGHAFVCDGYGSDEKFHFNWGWGGSYNNDWFTLDNLTPAPNYIYNNGQEAIFNILPAKKQDYCNFNISLVDHFSSGGTHQNIPKTLTTLESVPENYPSAWRTIASGQSAEYVAHEEIVLLPGFTAEAGSNFVARIEPCDNCNSARVKVKNIHNGIEIEEELYIAVGDIEEEQILGESKALTEELQVYPNPSTGMLTIHAKNNKSRIEIIELYNIQGTKLFNFNGNFDFFQEINVSHLPSQVYILKILVNGHIITKKLILQK